ncbi:sec14 cytosolic factor family protein [Schizosaccharomyces octosporus yFS286]|uniref:Sec14 cytosolic factor family protein n=1 Tax=Schizosaccharomyces octosporus (strain yFS286) TaxID=483514 RepID=S9RA18_SCHOY|nr:sec14 cytosolic factor family protein [Schizosaccharomyces octosporus yFS286]EPX70979.1 sec14 cytosolic factor family protein [Schizosaccharomyces octosporus yFS286]
MTPNNRTGNTSGLSRICSSVLGICTPKKEKSEKSSPIRPARSVKEQRPNLTLEPARSNFSEAFPSQMQDSTTPHGTPEFKNQSFFRNNAVSSNNQQPSSPRSPLSPHPTALDTGNLASNSPTERGPVQQISEVSSPPLPSGPLEVTSDTKEQNSSLPVDESPPQLGPTSAKTNDEPVSSELDTKSKDEYLAPASEPRETEAMPINFFPERSSSGFASSPASSDRNLAAEPVKQSGSSTSSHETIVPQPVDARIDNNQNTESQGMTNNIAEPEPLPDSSTINEVNKTGNMEGPKVSTGGNTEGLEEQSKKELNDAGAEKPIEPSTLPNEVEADGAWNAPLPFPSPHCQLKPQYLDEDLTEEQKSMYKEVFIFCQDLKSIPVSPKSEEKEGLSEIEKYFLTKECILRFLRATKWNAATTKKRILDTLVWRRQFGVNNMDPDEVQEENATGKQVLLGFDKDGRPCLYLYPGRQNTKTSPLQIRHLVFSLECAIELMPPGVETLALLINFKASSNRSNPSVGQGKEVLNILQTHYCERLGKALVINIPWAVWGFFKLISPFIDPITREKLKFNEPLERYVPMDQLDTNFGGSLKFEYFHEKYWPKIVELCKTRRENGLERWRKMGSKIGTSEWDIKGGNNYINDMKNYIRPGLGNRSGSPTMNEEKQRESPIKSKDSDSHNVDSEYSNGKKNDFGTYINDERQRVQQTPQETEVVHNRNMSMASDAGSFVTADGMD